MNTKVCRKCERRLPVSEFHKNKGRLESYCKDCNKKRVQEWRDANPEKQREKGRKNSKEWRQNNREKYNEATKERMRRYRAKKKADK